MTEQRNNWLQFLTSRGAALREGDVPEVDGFSVGQSPDLDAGFMAPLVDLGLIAASGMDAAGFLHNQLTNDVEHLGSGEVRLAGYCSAKGRLLASLLLWRSGDTILLEIPGEIQATVQKRLQMFVLRSKAVLSDAGATHAVLGFGGRNAGEVLRGSFPSLPAAPYEKTESELGTLLRLADSFGSPRYQWITGFETAKQMWPALSAKLGPAGPSAWRLSEIAAGIPRITRATQEQFVPQMINFELIGGVNFKKGCYPGQEIVARSQYLGKLKRRMVLASVPAGEQVTGGTEVFSAADPDQPAGMIVNAERRPAGGVLCLVEIKTAALDGVVHLGSAQGPALQFEPLPYPLPEVA